MVKTAAHPELPKVGRQWIQTPIAETTAEP